MPSITHKKSSFKALIFPAATALLVLATLAAVAQAFIGRARLADDVHPGSSTDSVLADLRQAQDQALAGRSRWIDEPHRRVSLPISDAMRLTAATGGKFIFPSTAPFVAKAAGVAAAGALPPGLSPTAVAAGRKVYQTIGCAACHPIDGTNLINNLPAPGPGFKDLFGSTVPLESGQSVLADALYIRESIRSPQAKIHKGYTAVQMPNFGSAVSDKDISNVIAFLKANSRNYPGVDHQ